MSDLPSCQKCKSEYTYADGLLYICPECGFEWSIKAENHIESDDQIGNESDSVKGVNGASLIDRDSITVIKDLKVKGTSSVVKVGTKVKNIRLVNGDHNIDCKIAGIGAMKLKSEFVKRSD